MTVASTTNRKPFSGDGVTTSFGTSPVVFYESTDLVVEVYSAAGVATTLTEATQYTVSGGSPTGATGTVNLAGGSAPYGAPAVGTTLLIRRILPLRQDADFVNNDINDAEVSETALDKLTMIAQQISETSGRGVAIPAVETATDALTVLPFDRASKFLAFDANKEMIASDGPAGDNVPVSTFMATVLDDTTAADARTTLGAAGSGAATTSGLTMSTSRILGRTTAGTGSVEELTMADALALLMTARGDLIVGGSLGVGARLPIGTAGQVLQSDGTTAGWATVGLVLGTTQASTSGTEVDFTGLPSGIKRITITFSGVSTNGTDNWLIQLGDSGGIENSGYLGSGAGVPSGSSPAVSNYTAGFGIRSASAASVLHGTVELCLLDAATNLWSCNGSLASSAAAEMYLTAGSKALSATLDKVRVTTSAGANVFDAGSINLAYE